MSMTRSESAKGSDPYAKGSKDRSPHAQWYADTVPAMIPIALLGSAVYFVSN